MTYDRVAFYVTAHQDDWELFRGEQAFADLKMLNTKIVFVFTTAGDAGQTDGWWEAREQGALAAVRAALPASPLTIYIANIAGHPIIKYSCANSVVYCMRLPDGNIDGVGFPSTGNNSLAKLRDANAPIIAVDGSTTYRSWEDFCNTLEGILTSERQA